MSSHCLLESSALPARLSAGGSKLPFYDGFNHIVIATRPLGESIDY